LAAKGKAATRGAAKKSGRFVEIGAGCASFLCQATGQEVFMLDITAPYAAVLAVLGGVLAARVSITRAKTGISLGPGDSAPLLMRMRQFGNFAENVPLALILLALAEAQGLSAPWLHGAAALLVAARLVHPMGLDAGRVATPARIIGAMGTRIAMLIPVVAIGAGALGL
jgi:hypothetical protein